VNGRVRRLATIARLAVACGLALLLGSRSAAAFCRSSACEFGQTGTRCSPERDEDCGLPLYWKEPCIGFSVQRDGSEYFAAETVAELMSQAFAKWNGVDCGSGSPEVVVKRQPNVACAVPEYNFDFNVNRGNANVVMFRDDDWPHPGREDVLALTTVTYDAETGEIYDADIEINTYNFLFTTSDTDVTYDLLSTLEHEAGHFLGISHSETEDSVMGAEPALGSIQHRELTADDAAAICDVYPPAETPIAATCSPMPHDFASPCGQELRPPSAREPDGGCSASPARAPLGAPSFFIAVSVLALALVRRRHHPRDFPRSRGTFSSNSPARPGVTSE
jgi:MYXO-CTERM domain-containing protein